MPDYSIFQRPSPFAEPPEEPEVVSLEKLEAEEDEEPAENETDETKEAETAPAEPGADGEGLAPGEAEEDGLAPGEPPGGDGAEADGEEEGPAKEEEPGEVTEVTIDGKAVAVEDIREALKERDESRGRFRQAKELIDHVKTFRRDITENPADTLRAIFTQLFGGDSRKAYEHVGNIAERVVYEKMQFDELPDDQKELFFAAQERNTIKKELEQLRQEKTQKETSEKEKAAIEAKHAELTRLLKGEGIEPSRRNIGRLATIILEEREDGLPDDEKRSLRTLRRQIQEEREEVLKTLRADDLPPEIKEQVRKQSIEEVKKRSGPAANTGSKPAKPKGRSRKRSYTRYSTGGFADAIAAMD